MADHSSTPQPSVGPHGSNTRDVIDTALEKGLTAIAAEPVPDDLKRSAEALDQALRPGRSAPEVPEQP